MAARWVPSAQVRPHKCACIPFIGGHHPEGFFDFGTEIMAFDGHVYVSVVAAKQMAERMGWAPVGVNPLKGELERALERQGELEARLVEAENKLKAVEVLKAAGFSAARKPGRPVKERQAA